jgi:imidazoleglycerol phosphate synthase cyclase subunit
VLTRRVIPCLDTRDGRVVKGVRFRDLRDAGVPAELASRYEADGADEIVLLDVVATDRDRGHALDTVRAVRRDLRIPLTVGGGVRSLGDAAALLDAGADKVAVNTAAIDRPALLGELADRFGTQCVVLAIDAATADSGWRVFRRAGQDGTSLDVVQWSLDAARRGAGELLLTSIDRDGTRSGYDTRLLRAVCSAVAIPVIASGGARRTDDLMAAFDAGADAVLAASMFHDGDTTITAVKAELALCGVEMRR